MAEVVLIAGASGTGKSTAIYSIDKYGIKIKGLDPQETFIVSIAGNSPVVRGSKKLYPKFDGNSGRWVSTNSYSDILKLLYSLEASVKIKNIVFDDVQYLLSLDYFDRRNQEGYDKYAKIGFSFIQFLTALKNLKGDKTVFLLMHTDEFGDGVKLVTKIKTIGKMLDEKFTIEGLFTIILIARRKFEKLSKKMKYYFRTTPEHEGDIAKAPLGMFTDEKDENILDEIPNDLGYVRDMIINYQSQ